MIRLTIGTGLVTCDIRGRRAAQEPKAPNQRTADLLWRLPREPSDSLLREVGVALASRFLGGAVGSALADELRRPGRHRIGFEVTDPAVADLPWETVVPVGRTDPLALDPHVDMYRTTSRSGRPSAAADRGPLRVLAAVAAPDDSSGELLDHERELGRILDAVEPGRRDGLGVRVLEWGSAAAIRSALAEEACGVLHISCHARPGALLLETASGEEDAVDAGRFLRDVLPAPHEVPLIVLAGCSTALEGDSELPGLARSLLDSGVPAVLAMTGAVSDGYATELSARLYEGLANRPGLDLLRVFSEVRRELAGTPGTFPEWATPALFLADPELRPAGSRPGPPRAVEEPDRPSVVLDGLVRARHDFVGRRSALRAMSGPEPRILLHGIGGIGKTSLAAELVRRFATATDGVVVAVGGETSPDAILDQLLRRLRAHCARKNLARTDPLRRVLIALGEPGREWRDRLRETARVAVPLLLVLDNAEDNLDAGHRLADGDLAAFLGAWAAQRPTIVTSRHPFPVPGLEARHLPPLTWQETRKLIWRLPGVDALTPPEQRRVWARLGGHPRSLEYLDALLRDGGARVDGVGALLSEAPAGRAAPPGALGQRLDETGALIARDVLLPELISRLGTVPSALPLLLGAAVYRLPVDRDGLVWQLADLPDAPPAEAEPPPAPDGTDDAVSRLLHLGLLAPVGDAFLVHRWTAEALARLAGPERLTEAHRRASAYWARRSGAEPGQALFITRVLEARYHALAAGLLVEALDYTKVACLQLRLSGQWDREELLRRQALALTAPGSLRTAEQLAELGGLDSRRGRYERAEDRYRRALAVFEELGAEEQAGAALHQLGMIAEYRGDAAEAEALYRRSMAVKEVIGHRQGKAITLHQLAGLALDRGDDRLAERQYTEALALCEELDDVEGIAAAQHQLGALARRAKDYVRAEHCARSALSLHQGLGDRVNEGNGRLELANIARARFDDPAAQTEVRAALEIFEDVGLHRSVAESCQMLGEISCDLGDLSWAEECFFRARELFAALGEKERLAACGRRLGVVRTLLGRVAEAVPYTLEAWLDLQRLPRATEDLEWLAVQRLELGAPVFDGIVRQHADASTADHALGAVARLTEFYHSGPGHTLLGSAYVKLGIAAIRRKDAGLARVLLLHALPLCEAAGFPEGTAKCHEDLGHAHLESGRLDEAEQRYRAALAVYRHLGNDTNVAIVHHGLGRVCQERRAYAEAEEHFRASVEVKRRLGNRAGVSNSVFHLGRVAQMRGDHALAERCFRECLAIDEADGARAETALDYGELGNLRAVQGRSEEALPLMIQALSLNRQLKSDNTALNITALRKQRAALGDERFISLLRRTCDEDSVSAVLAMTATLPGGGPRPGAG
ncbi:tetratricopeptide repeat protein [Streptomyces sp. NPDC020141]|uniref:tetratricopeptide repeat protein n=1 Tax=Streptomyces sp. NPDC020141 TaxID=3365065 RepID=UPI003788EF9B